MARQNDFRLQFRGAGNGRVEVVNFKPQKHAVASREFPVTDRTMMVLHLPVMQLKHQPAIRNEPLIIWTAMVTLAAK